MKSNRFKGILKNKPLVGILLLAVLLRFLGLIPNITNVDEAFIQIKSWGLVNGVMSSLDFNPRSFKYGSLMFYLQALFAFPVLLSGYLMQVANTLFSSSFTAKILPFSEFFGEAVREYSNTLVFVGRAQTAIFGVLSVWILYLIGKKLFNNRVALLTALIFAVAPLHVRDSHYITTDILSVFSSLVAILFLVNMFQTKKLKWFLLSGIALGISSTIRYFPVTILAYPIALFLSFEKNREWIKKLISSVLGIGIGLFVGLPFLFLEKNGVGLLMDDLQKYALPWYGTSLSNFVFLLPSWILSGGKTQLPAIAAILPSFANFKAIHSSWIFFISFGILPTIASLFGIVILFIKSRAKFFFLVLIPLFTFIYISFYIPSTYERLVIPLLPFLALFAGIGMEYLIKSKRPVIGSFIIVVILLQPLSRSFSASLACSQDLVQVQSNIWVDKNIPESAKIGYLTVVSVPPKNYGAWFQLEPGQDLSLEEARSKGLDHAFINAGRLDYNTYSFFNLLFVPPSIVYENSYYSLVLAEYYSRAHHLGTVRKPLLCDNARIYYYKLPEQLERGKKQVPVDNWQILEHDKTGKANIKTNDREMQYTQSSYQFTPPRITSSKISVEQGKTYSLSFRAKAESQLSSLIGRIDMYDNNDSKTNWRHNFLLLEEGATPMYFEKKRELGTVNDSNLPGKIVGLSKVARLSDDWQQVTITVKAEKDVDYATFSIQPISTEAMSLSIDQITVTSQ